MTTDINNLANEPSPVISKKFGVTVSDASLLIAGKRRLDQLPRVWTTEELLAYEFPAPKWIVPNYIMEGLTILAGRPKVGKSWLSLQLLRDVSAGGIFFNQQCEPRHCFYLALEDTPRRIQSRMKTQVWTATSGIEVKTGLPSKLDKDGMDWLIKTIESEGYELVIIDTISRALSAKTRQSNNDEIGAIYDKLQSLALNNNIAVVLIDHMNKQHKDADFLDAVMGGTAKAGNADCIIGLRKERNHTSATLELTGRDIDEKSYSLEFDKQTCTWSMLGDTNDVITDKSQKKLIRIIEQLGSDATGKNILKEAGWSKSYLSRIANQLVDSEKLKPIVQGEPYKVAFVMDDDMKKAMDMLERSKERNNSLHNSKEQ